MVNKANNQAETSQETIKAQTGPKDPSEMTSDELKAELLKAQSEKAAEPEVIEEVEEKPTEVEQETVESDEIPEDLRDKSQAELAKTLVNLRKLKGQQDNELGELRKFKKQQEEIQAQMEESNLSSSAQKMIRSEIKGMTPEEKQAFYDKFADSPEEALFPLIQQALHPILIQQAKQNNESAINRLKESTKDSLVPYEEQEINKIIASFNRNGRNELFDQYGSDAFQAAYDLYFKQNVAAAVERRIQEATENAKKKADDESGKKNPYVEPQGVSAASKSGKLTEKEIEGMTLSQIEETLGIPPEDRHIRR